MKRTRYEWPMGVAIGLIVGDAYGPNSILWHVLFGVVLFFLVLDLVETVLQAKEEAMRRKTRNEFPRAVKKLKGLMDEFTEGMRERGEAKIEYSDEVKDRAKAMFAEQIGGDWEMLAPAIQQRWYAEVKEEMDEETREMPNG